ncbi:MAG: DNA primase [Candidatus Xenolissoclinum pacificiensis L6]|uniref:DNA primase n=1 Tax=Candidatus Xenolissoclinum pacificiensis L6 TaxID=1401685 RepID=W2UZW8_9RICK|nr:MAG: DNA primase [Candidatus Xenolissoclinum pacificiensis L6]
MDRIHKHTIDKIKQHVVLSDLISQVVELKKSGNQYIGLCPFHNEKTPSFVVNNYTRVFHCFGCGAHGDVFEFLMRNNNYSFMESVVYMAQYTGLSIENVKVNHNNHSILVMIHKWFMYQLDRNPHIKQRVIERFSEDLVRKFQIGYVPRYGLLQYLREHNFTEKEILSTGLLNKHYKQILYDRITFPILNTHKQVIAFGGRRIVEDPNIPKYINSAETENFKKKKVLYGEHLYDRSTKYVLVVEGYTDVIASHRIGISNTLGILGTSLTEDHIHNLVGKYEKIYLCFDGDNAGINALKRTLKIILSCYYNEAHMFQIVNLPDNTDPEQIIMRYKKRGFLNFLKNSDNISTTIWKLICSEITLDKLPETFLLIEQKINAFIEQIQSAYIRKDYRTFLFKKLNQLRYSKKNYSYKSPSMVVEEDEIAKELILGIVITYSEILDENNMEERFAVISFINPLLQQIQQRIISLYSMQQLISENVIAEYLSQKGRDILKNVMTKVKSFDLNSLEDAQELLESQMNILENKKMTLFRVARKIE